MNENDEDHVLRAQLAALMQEHRDLDTAIAAMVDSGVRDQLQQVHPTSLTTLSAGA